MTKKIVILLGIFLFCVIGVVLWYLKTHKQNAAAPLTVQDQGSIELLPVAPSEETVTESSYQVADTALDVDGQMVVVYYPVGLREGAPLILYSHGSNEHVTPEIIPAGFADALPRYGEYFAERGAFFAASEMYGENWGSSQSQIHLLELITYFKETYAVGDVYMFGFSMGGLPALRTARRFPESIDKVALLAPTIETDDWTETTLAAIEAIPVYIWHGTADVNVPISFSRELTVTASNLGFSNITLEEIVGETHRHFLEPEVLWAFFTKM